MEYYAAERKDEGMKFTYKWMYLEKIMLSEISQKERDRYRMTCLLPIEDDGEGCGIGEQDASSGKDMMVKGNEKNL